MAFYSIDDPELYGRATENMAAVRQAGGMDGIQIANFVLGTPENNSPACTVLKMSPGHVLPRHGHNCWRFEVVVQGSVTVPGGRVLGPGSLMYSAPNELYGQHVAGPEGCTTIEIFSDYNGSHGIVIEGPDGMEECDIHTEQGANRVVELLTAQTA